MSWYRGAHKLTLARWAANAIVVPALDMLSNLAASDAPDLAAHVIGNRPPSSRMWQHWRGRFGMDEEQQADVWAKIEAGIAAAAAPPDTAAASEKPHTHTGKTVPLTFKLHSGEKRVVHARLGDTLLDVGQEHGLPSIEGVCGGNLGEEIWISSRVKKSVLTILDRMRNLPRLPQPLACARARRGPDRRRARHARVCRRLQRRGEPPGLPDRSHARAGTVGRGRWGH